MPNASTASAAPAEKKFPTVDIPLDHVDIPTDARPHDAEDVDDTAQDMKEEGQLQEIVVHREGDRYSVLAGVGRVLAARKLEWTQIRASVREGLSEFEKARLTFSENDKRQNADPLYQAGRLDKMLASKEVKTQVELAHRLGKSEGWVSDHLAFLNFPEEAKEIFSALKISLNALQAVKSLSSKDLQSQVAQELEDKKLKPGGVEKRCKELGKNSHKSQADSSKLIAAQPDPLADVWPEAKRLDANDSLVQWEVAYGSHKIPNMKGRTMDGWTFTVCPMLADQGAKELAKWLYQLSQAVAKKAGIDPTKTSFQETLELKQQTDQTLKKIFKARLPETPEENKALEAIAIKEGPYGVYAWIYGQVNPMTQTMKQATWEQMAVTPQEGLRQILEGIEKFQGVPPTSSPAQTPQPQAEAPASDEDAKIAAMIAKQVARGRVIR